MHLVITKLGLLLSIDTWVLDLMLEVAKNVATYITVEELKKRIFGNIPKEKTSELKKRLSSSLSMLARSGTKISDRDIFLKLSNYPGMIRILQDEDFRKEHMKLDTGTGIVVLDDKSKEMMLASRTSIEDKLLSCLEGWEQEYFWPAFTVSLPGTLSEIRSKKLGQNELSMKYQKEYLRFEKETEDKRLELDKRIDRVTNLKLAVGEYESEVKRTLTGFSDLLHEYIKEYDVLMNMIYPNITPELRSEVGYMLYTLQLRLLTLISALDLVAKIYGLEWHGRGDWPMSSLERLGKQVIRFLTP